MKAIVEPSGEIFASRSHSGAVCALAPRLAISDNRSIDFFIIGKNTKIQSIKQRNPEKMIPESDYNAMNVP